jgi:hypothetical protein
MTDRPAGALLGRSFRFMRTGSALAMVPVPRILLLIGAILIALPASLAAQAITVTVSGADPNNWYVGSFGSGDVALPGNNFTNSVQTGPNVDIDVSGFPPGQWVRVLSSKNNDASTTWNSQYTLWVQIIDGGTGTGGFTASITGWVQITTVETELFQVRRDRTGITVQLELRNLTVAAGTTASTPSFLTTVNYTARRP